MLVARIPSVEYPAAGNGTTDDAAIFQAALDAIGTKTGGGAAVGSVLLVYPTEAGYRIGTTLNVWAEAQSMIGVGNPKLLYTGATGTDAILFSGQVNDHSGISKLSGFTIDAAGGGRDLVRVASGINLHIEDMLLLNAGRDGLHIEPYWNNVYIEALYCANVKVYASARSGFRIEAGNTAGQGYVNQSTFINCNARYSIAGHPLEIINSSTAGDIQKISMVLWLQGELDCAGGSAADCVSIHNTGNSKIEYVHFQDVAIEDAQSGVHPGYAINTNGNNGVLVTNCILFGMINNTLN